MAIYNLKISMMLVAAFSRLKADGDTAEEEFSIRNGANDAGALTLKAKQTGAVIRTYWLHDGCRIPKHAAVRIMRQHEEIERHQTLPPQAR